MAAAGFTTGSPLRHVIVMTTTGSIGLMAVFAVDLANLFYISILGVKELAAAVGFAGVVLFFQISMCIGLTIGAGAIVARAIGAGEREDAPAGGVQPRADGVGDRRRGPADRAVPRPDPVGARRP